MRALELSALREWHYLLGCASAQVQSSLNEIPFFSFVMRFIGDDRQYKGNSFIFICDEFNCDDRQTHKQTKLFFNMVSY